MKNHPFPTFESSGSSGASGSCPSSEASKPFAPSPLSVDPTQPQSAPKVSAAKASGSLGLASLAVHRVLKSLLDSSTHVTVACSGGADSLALAACAFEHATHLGLPIAATIVDHGLREDSAAEAALVAQRLRGLGFSQVFICRVQVGSEGGPEAGARVARYRALTESARDFAGTNPAVVLLGHTLDDQAETVLLGLARGSGARSLAGMASRFVSDGVVFLRPLLGLRREDTAQACRQLGLEYVVDPSNFPDGPWRAADGSPLRRAALRHRVLPALAEVFGKDVGPNLARTADRLREDYLALEDWAQDVFERAVVHPSELSDLISTEINKLKNKKPTDEKKTRVSLGKLEETLDTVQRAQVILRVDALVAVPGAVPGAVTARVLRRAAVSAGAIRGELTAEHTAALRALINDFHGQGPIPLPGLVQVRRLRINATLAVVCFTGL